MPVCSARLARAPSQPGLFAPGQSFYFSTLCEIKAFRDHWRRIPSKIIQYSELWYSREYIPVPVWYGRYLYARAVR